MRIAVASSNPGKLAEFRALLQPLSIEPVSQGELGISGAPEIRGTFIENALDKARHVAAACGLPTLADDSGLVVPALGGAPGIRSARYAGDGASDRDNNAALVAALEGISARGAFYYCVLVLLDSAADPAPLIATGRWDGHIVSEPRGQAGFGYDPHFLLPELGLTAAELGDRKNRISHRAQAMQSLLEQLAR